MSTWWDPVLRSDLGLGSVSGARPFNITNRRWYFLFRLLSTGGAKPLEPLAAKESFIPTQLATHWGNCISGAAAGDWFLLGRFDGVAVVADGIVHATEADRYKFSHELTPLSQTPTFGWLLSLGEQLSMSTNGFFMSGKPKKGSTVSVVLTKGDKVDIAKLAEDAGGAPGGLTKIRLGLGWDARRGAGEQYDLDACVVALNAAGVVPDSDWFVFFNNKQSPNGAIVHHGDELTGAAAGDDEQISVDLSALPADVVDLRPIINIFKAKDRGGQSFSEVDNAFIRIIDETTGTELCRYDLTENTEKGTNSIELGKIYRVDSGPWQFKANPVQSDREIDGVVADFKV